MDSCGNGGADARLVTLAGTLDCILGGGNQDVLRTPSSRQVDFTTTKVTGSNGRYGVESAKCGRRKKTASKCLFCDWGDRASLIFFFFSCQSSYINDTLTPANFNRKDE